MQYYDHFAQNPGDTNTNVPVITTLSEIWITTQYFSFNTMQSKVPFDKLWWFCSGLDVLTYGAQLTNGLTLIAARMSNRMSSKTWDEITYPFPNLNHQLRHTKYRLR